MPLDSMSLEYLISDSICKDSIYSKSDNWLISKNQVDCIKAQYQSFPPKSFFVCVSFASIGLGIFEKRHTQICRSSIKWKTSPASIKLSCFMCSCCCTCSIGLYSYQVWEALKDSCRVLKNCFLAARKNDAHSPAKEMCTHWNIMNKHYNN